jgi:isochorismate synthase/2-succinyl-5-enolpyruvyl-6-hydroxy-3-cyclohexene-1-carboxylate synthase/2-succinyl-6-hydroxy-2,4-cyclohexadiene-1-carboxylate synthase/O-succinylbenzoate synthase
MPVPPPASIVVAGDVEQDFWLSFDLLRSPKDHIEFAVVRDWVGEQLRTICDDVCVEVPKSVLKQGGVQHLYGKLSGRLRAGCSDAELLAALHPTPAVCGRPRGDAMALLAEAEPFDRGYYAGPFGWMGHDAAEFAVAIRSALIQPPPQQQPAAAGPTAAGIGQQAQQQGGGRMLVSLYAGVGIVTESDVASEWAELDLKVRQYERLLRTLPPLHAEPNINALWARLAVEELCRLGCNTFCVAPGEPGYVCVVFFGVGELGGGGRNIYVRCSCKRSGVRPGWWNLNTRFA